MLILDVLAINGAASFDEELGRRLAAWGVRVGIVTLCELADWVTEVVR